MDQFTALFPSLVARGASVEAALSELRSAGASPIQAIKAIHDVQVVSLGEAKRVFSESPAWAQEVRDGDALHAELTAIMEKERAS
jgi:hypothetical protein